MSDPQNISRSKRNYLASDIPFRPLDPRLIVTRYIAAAIFWGVILVGEIACAIYFSSHTWPWIFPIATLVPALIWFAFITRRTRAFGYFEGEEALFIRKGVLLQSLEVIPYGRLQKVTVEAGPLLKRYGLAEVHLVTASANSDGTIPGVPEEDAEKIRMRLTHEGIARLEGM